MKKQKRNSKNLLGSKGPVVDVTSRESMSKLSDAMESKYQEDQERRARLRSVQFFHDVLEGYNKRKKEKREAKIRAPLKKSNPKEPEARAGTSSQGARARTSSQGARAGTSSQTQQKDKYYLPRIRPQDMAYWNELISLQKMYYVMEHPTADVLKWERRITKKKKTEKFTEQDYVEWKAAQMLKLREMEKWAEMETLLRKKKRLYGIEDSESDEDPKELEELYEMFDPARNKHKSKKKADVCSRPFKFYDEGMEDGNESCFSDDSEYTDEELDKLIEEWDHKVSVSDDDMELTPKEEIFFSKVFSNYPEFTRQYREEVFKRMEKAETTEEWIKIFFDSFSKPEKEEQKEKKDDLKEISQETESGKEEGVRLCKYCSKPIMNISRQEKKASIVEEKATPLKLKTKEFNLEEKELPRKYGKKEVVKSKKISIIDEEESEKKERIPEEDSLENCCLDCFRLLKSIMK